MPLINKHVEFLGCSYDYLSKSMPGFDKPMEALMASGGMKRNYENALDRSRRDQAENSNNSKSTNDSKKITSVHDDLNTKGLFVSSGGRIFDTFHAQVMHLDLNNGKWREITRLPLALAHHQTALCKNVKCGRNGPDSQSYSYFVVGGTHSAHAGTIPNNTCSGNSVPTGPATPQALRLDLTVTTHKSDLNERWENLPDLQQPRSHFSLDLLGANTERSKKFRKFPKNLSF